jgi:hypothetical protein
MEKKWHAIYTREACERKVSNSLSKRQIINYLPLNRTSQLYSIESKKYILKPLFHNMLFVKIDETERWRVKRNEDVINFYYWLGRIAIIEENEIKNMQLFVGKYANIIIHKIPIQLKRLYGIDSLSQQKDFSIENDLIKTKLHSIGYSLEANIEKMKTSSPAIPLTKETFSHIEL